MALAAGFRLGPYLVSAKIGEGGMGEVYLAEDTRLKRKVALKTVLTSEASSAESRRRLVREARSAAQLNHPHIAAIYDVLDSGDRAYIVMEYVPGETLRTRLKRGPLPVRQAVDVGVQLADALAEAHSHGIVHRDLKPGNVSLTEDGKIKVLDFGIAKATPTPSPGGSDVDTHSASVTEPGRLVGTPAYMAPEQLLGQPVGPEADLYAVGVMLFELLTGRHPYDGRSSPANALSVLSTPVPHVIDAAPSVPKELDTIVARTMAKHPADRHSTARALRLALMRINQAADVGDTRGWLGSRRLDRSLEVARRLPHPRMWLTGAALLVAALATFSWRSLGPTPISDGTAPVVVVMPLENVSADPLREYLGVGFADALIANLSGLPGVTVVSRSATTSYRDQEWSAREIARDLGASFVVDGGVQESPNGLSVTVSVARSDASVAYAETFVGNADDIFDLQRRMAEGIVEGLEMTLTSADRQRFARAPTTDLDAYADYTNGRALLERPDVAGNVTLAIERFTRAVGRDPEFALSHAALGEAYWTQYLETNEADWVDRATASILEALRLDPDRPQVRVALATIYIGTGRSAAALDELGRALVSQPNSDEAHRLIGGILATQGQLDEAVAHYGRAIELRPGYWRNYGDLGTAYFRAGRFIEAAREYQRVVDLQPDNGRAVLNLGAAYHAAGDTDRAVVNYERAIQLGPTARAHANLGTIHYEEERYEDAAAAYERALVLGPTSVTQGSLGYAYQQLGRVAEARAAFAEAVRLFENQLQVNPKDALSLARMAVFEAKIERYADAERHVEEAVALNPTSGELLNKKAEVLAIAGKPEAAIAALELALVNGYSTRAAREDDDLEALRDLDRFRELVSEGR